MKLSKERGNKIKEDKQIIKEGQDKNTSDQEVPLQILDEQPESAQQSEEEVKNEVAFSDEKIKEKQKIDLQQFNDKIKQKGVCYISSLPPYMKVSFIKGLLEPYGIERVYFVPEDESKRKQRIQMKGNKQRKYVEGWVEFSDKRVAKMAALSLNCTKMVRNKRSPYADDLWCIRYLPKFKWENLTEKFAYDEKVRREKLRAQLQQAKKQDEYYQEQSDLSKKVLGIKKRKQKQLEKQQQRAAQLVAQQTNAEQEK